MRRVQCTCSKDRLKRYISPPLPSSMQLENQLTRTPSTADKSFMQPGTSSDIPAEKKTYWEKWNKFIREGIIASVMYVYHTNAKHQVSQNLVPKLRMTRSVLTLYSLSFNHGAVSFAAKLKGLLVISGLRGLNLTAKSPSSVSLSSFRGGSPPATASREFIRLPPLDSFWMAMRCSGGLSATARACGRVNPPWKSEKDDTATSPISGDNGLLSARANPWPTY